MLKKSNSKMLNEVNKICRTCLVKNVKLFSIFDNRLAEKLEYILDTSIESSDELPQKVCHDCSNDIDRCYSFKMKCNKSLEHLRNVLKSKEQPEDILHIKVEPELHISDGFQEKANESNTPKEKSGNELFAEPPVLETNGMSIKEERIEDVPIIDKRETMTNANIRLPNLQRILRNPMQKTNLSANDQTLPVDFESEVNSINVHTVQYSIVEVQEDQNAVDELVNVNINILHCASCGAGFAQESALLKHLDHCSARKPNKAEKNSENNRKKHFCPYCGKGFPRPCRLQNHLRYHEPERKKEQKTKHECPYCDKSFSLSSSLLTHISIHNEHFPFKCTLCGQGFNKKFNYHRHLSSHANANAKKHACRQCDRIFLVASHLKRHALDHRSGKPHTCDLCSKQFPYRYLLKQHILKHKDGKPFKCKFCGNGFTRVYNRNTHEQKHCESKI